MRFKLIYLTIIFSFLTIFVGCNNTNSLEKQLAKMEKIINKDKIFNSDYAISYLIEYEGDYSSSLTYNFKKDNDNFYLNYNDNIEIWFIKDGEKYYVFYKDKISKYYKEIDDFDEFISELNLSVQTNLKKVYENCKKEIEKLMDKCNEEISCTVVKKFNQVRFSANYENSGNEYLIKNGKLMSITSFFDYLNQSMRLTYTYSYSNQEIVIPNKDNFK